MQFLTKRQLVGIGLLLLPVEVELAQAATQTATYTVRFEATWSSTSHPMGFPANAHFSSLIGGTHNSNVHFWRDGELASLGIKDMAERGLTAPLAQEVTNAIGAGHAGAVINGGAVPVSPGVATASFQVSQTHSLVSLVTMVAPSPDWFVGVESLPLFVGGEWLEQLTVPLFAYDAGTDCGTTYQAANCIQNPFIPIAPGANPPFTSGVALGIYRFSRTDAHITTTVPSTGSAGLVGFALLMLGVGGFVVLRRARHV